ncbi:OsmC family protein [Rufibacter sp. XAAS-G3-1]|uniref:OsmC family protein n=1 Tax=Rufibacter sp. XAAS-G3-1 TaxID=2729134 RepID=UPI0015E6F3BF|nr:OsmC family protein [Rufibacter sp. XAAS-G3-1]
MIRIEMNRVGGDYGFEARDANGHVITTDTSPESGGINFGVRPMQMLLMALGGCSGIDVAMILKKQRQELTGFKMVITGERETGKEPALWTKIHVVFELQGPHDLPKAERACELSMEKYCSVAETLRRAGAEITWEVRVTA